MFDIFMSVVFTFSFIIYSTAKKIKFKKAFFLGAVSYIIKIILFDYILYSVLNRILDEFDLLSDEAFLFINRGFLIIYFFIISIYMVFGRIFCFKVFFKKNEICFYDMMSFAVGFCSLYNFFNCTIPCFKNMDIFFHIPARITFVASFSNILAIMGDVGFCVLILYLLERKSKIKYLFLIFVVFLDVLTTLVSVVLTQYKDGNFKWYYNNIFLFIMSFMYLFVAIILKGRLKNEKGKHINIK